MLAAGIRTHDNFFLVKVNFVALFLLVNVIIYIQRFWIFYYTKNADGTYPNIMYMISRANGTTNACYNCA